MSKIIIICLVIVIIYLLYQKYNLKPIVKENKEVQTESSGMAREILELESELADTKDMAGWEKSELITQIRVLAKENHYLRAHKETLIAKLKKRDNN